MYPDQAELLVGRMRKQWRDPAWGEHEAAAWLTLFTSTENFGYVEALDALTEWTRGSDRRPHMAEIASLMRHNRPPGDDELPTPAVRARIIAEIKATPAELRLIEQTIPEPKTQPVCDECGLAFLPGSPLIGGGLCQSCLDKIEVDW